MSDKQLSMLLCGGALGTVAVIVAIISLFLLEGRMLPSRAAILIFLGFILVGMGFVEAVNRG